MESSKLTSKHQVTIPADVRAELGLKAGDRVAFVVEEGRAMLHKIEPIDWEWAKFIESTLTEWNSPEDNEAWAYLDR